LTLGAAAAYVWAVCGLESSTYETSREVFLRGLHLCYLAFFVSFLHQREGLVGLYGLVPLPKTIADYELWTSGVLKRSPAIWTARYLTLPIKTWFYRQLKGAQDGPPKANYRALDTSLYLGVAVAVSGAFLQPSFLKLALLWVLTFIVKSITGSFTNFQWDLLLLESGFVGAWLAAAQSVSARAVLMVALQLLHVRLLLGSGWVKITSGCESWRQLTATSYHFFTQPLPRGPLAPLLSRASPAAHACMTALAVYSELLLPLLWALPCMRLVCVAGPVMLHVSISLTGHYGFFSVLSSLLAITGLDDVRWRALWALGGLQSTGVVSDRSNGPITIEWTWPQNWATPGTDTPSLLALLVVVRESVILVLGTAIVLSSLVALCRLFDSAEPAFPGFPRPAPAAATTAAAAAAAATTDMDKTPTPETGIKSGTKNKAAPQQQPRLILRAPWPFTAVYDYLLPFFCGFQYGLFAKMTLSRPELVLLLKGPGTGARWTPIEFPSKPGDPALGCKGVWPPFSLPRLDWLLWFQGLRAGRKATGKSKSTSQAKDTAQQRKGRSKGVGGKLPRWFLNLLVGVLEGSSEVFSLLAASAADVRAAALGDGVGDSASASASAGPGGMSPADLLEVRVDVHNYRFALSGQAWDARPHVDDSVFVPPIKLEELLNTLHQVPPLPQPSS
jgi:hypothetical protein